MNIVLSYESSKTCSSTEKCCGLVNCNPSSKRRESVKQPHTLSTGDVCCESAHAIQSRANASRGKPMLSFFFYYFFFLFIYLFIYLLLFFWAVRTARQTVSEMLMVGCLSQLSESGFRRGCVCGFPKTLDGYTRKCGVLSGCVCMCVLCVCACELTPRAVAVFFFFFFFFFRWVVQNSDTHFSPLDLFNQLIRGNHNFFCTSGCHLQPQKKKKKKKKRRCGHFRNFSFFFLFYCCGKQMNSSVWSEGARVGSALLGVPALHVWVGSGFVWVCLVFFFVTCFHQQKTLFLLGKRFFFFFWGSNPLKKKKK